jgi:RNA polymerase sigma factor (sigma-70 family)
MMILGMAHNPTSGASSEHAAMLDALTVDELSGHCREQTARYFRAEPSRDEYCFELFRRAIVRRSDEAWAAVYRQYSTFVRRWLGDKMDPDEAVSAAFERFWQALNQEKFGRFTSLSAVLGYLKMCVRTVAIDHGRAVQAQVATQQVTAAETLPAEDDVERSVVEQIDGAALWDRICATLQDERATRVLYLSYAVDLGPQEICKRYPLMFPNAQAVYQAKRNALDRMRRSGVLRSWEE